MGKNLFNKGLKMELEDLISINWEILEKEIERRIEIKVDLTPETIRNNLDNEERLGFTSQNIVQHTGCMKNIFKNLYVTSFSGGKLFKDDSGVKRIWRNVCLSWEFIIGGSSRIELMSVAYNFNKKEWKFF